jgi:hypothetical protein
MEWVTGVKLTTLPPALLKICMERITTRCTLLIHCRRILTMEWVTGVKLTTLLLAVHHLMLAYCCGPALLCL